MQPREPEDKTIQRILATRRFSICYISSFTCVRIRLTCCPCPLTSTVDSLLKSRRNGKGRANAHQFRVHTHLGEKTKRVPWQSVSKHQFFSCVFKNSLKNESICPSFQRSTPCGSQRKQKSGSGPQWAGPTSLPWSAS